MALHQPLIIATRQSQLALWQANHVRSLLEQRGHAVRILGLTTRGDQILEHTLSKVGGKALFVKELETALQEGRADLAVHSLKDVPMQLPDGLTLACVLEREDPRDAFVSLRYAGLAELPSGAVLGTSSLRRQALLRAHRPDVRIVPLRGNVTTRLDKLSAGHYDAIVLAAAGLMRLGLDAHIRRRFSPAEMLPAAGQGALGLETLAARADLHAWLVPLACPVTTACGLAERAVSRTLGGSCQVPLAAYAHDAENDAPEGNAPNLALRALVARPDGSRVLRAQAHGPAAQAEQLGRAVAADLLAAGAGQLLADLPGSPRADRPVP